MIPTMANTKVKIITTKGRTSQLQESQDKLPCSFSGWFCSPQTEQQKSLLKPKSNKQYNSVNLDLVKSKKIAFLILGGSDESLENPH